MISCVYAIENKITGKRYIGSASNFASRKENHFRRLSDGNHHSIKLQRSYEKHGKDSFSIRPLLYCDQKHLLMYEQRAIDVYQAATNGYNINPIAGSNAGRRWSAEVRQRMSAAKKGKPLPLSGMRRFGRKASLQHRMNISAALKGKKKSVEHCKRIAMSKQGMRLSLETRMKMSVARIGKKQSAETIAKRIATTKGRK